MRNSIPGPLHDFTVLWNIARAHGRLGHYQRAIDVYNKAIGLYDGLDGFVLSRLYLEQSRLWRLLGEHLSALEYAGRAAVAYRGWREPYFELAEIYYQLGDQQAAEACHAISLCIPRHAKEVDREWIYDDRLLADYLCQIRAAKREYPANPIQDRPSIKMLAGGDVCLARQLPGWVDAEGGDWCFSGLKGIFGHADLVLVNLESTVSTVGDFFDKHGRRPYYYRSRPEMLDILVHAGVSVVNIANNHAMDFDVEAFKQEMGILDCCGIAQCGGGMSQIDAAEPTYVKAGEFIIAFIGVDTETQLAAARPSQVGVNYSPESELLPLLAGSIAMARACSDCIIVTPHWGKNWAEKPTDERRGLAKKIIELGAHAILGHSAHILQGIEVHQGCPIIYDMGTLLFDRVSENRMRYSALFQMEIDASGVKAITVMPVRLRNARAELANPDDSEMILDLVENLSKDLQPDVEIERSTQDLRLPLNPMRHMPTYHGARPREYHDPTVIVPVPDFYRALPTNVVYEKVPAGFQWEEPFMANDGLHLVGARIAGHVRPGYGFVCEVFFRAARPSAGRWEARISGWDAASSRVFEYTNPVADGAWPQTRWNMEHIIGDRVVVRPPADLPEGRLLLTWCLVNRQSGERMSCAEGDVRVIQGEIVIGELHVDSKEPPGVAGIPSLPRHS